MKSNLEIKGLTGVLIAIIIFVHVMFFLLEAVFWMRPEVHNMLINLLNNPIILDENVQALTLRNLFINQGFYNLFLVFAGLGGWRFVARGKISAGYVLLLFLCVAAIGAGIVLACSTKAYLLAIFQAVPAGWAFIRLYPAFKKYLQQENQDRY